jgi:hypothetical protein
MDRENGVPIVHRNTERRGDSAEKNDGVPFTKGLDVKDSLLRHPIKSCVGVAVGIFLLYVIAYFVNVRAALLPFMSGLPPWKRVPEYRLGGRASQIAFAPIHELDKRVLRPRHWQYWGTVDDDYE